MSNHIKTFNESMVISLLNDLEMLSVAAKGVREKLLKVFPARYGSDLWWEKSDEEAIESIKEGRGEKFKTYEEAVKYLTK